MLQELKLGNVLTERIRTVEATALENVLFEGENAIALHPPPGNMILTNKGQKYTSTSSRQLNGYLGDRHVN